LRAKYTAILLSRNFKAEIRRVRIIRLSYSSNRGIDGLYMAIIAQKHVAISRILQNRVAATALPVERA